MGNFSTPGGQNADILRATINGESYGEPPTSEISALLIELNQLIIAGGGGGGGTTNYNGLTNKPQINGVELKNNKSLAELGIVIPEVDSALSGSSENPVQNKVVKAALDNKQDIEFIGTKAQWEALASVQQNKYTIVNITDDTDYVGNIVDAVENGNMKAVTSNAVFDKLESTIKAVTYDIASCTETNTFALPDGFTLVNSVFIGAQIYTRYNSWVDITYNMSTAATSSYWGNLIYNDNTHFRYTPFVADAAQKIRFVFIKVA